MKKMIFGLLIFSVLVSTVIAVTYQARPIQPITSQLPTQTLAQTTYKYLFTEKPAYTNAVATAGSGYVSAICNNTTGTFNSNIKATAGFSTDKVSATAGARLALSTDFTLYEAKGGPMVYLELYKVSTTAGTPDKLIQSFAFMPQTYVFKATSAPLAASGNYYARARTFSKAYSAGSEGKLIGLINKITLSPAP